MHRFVSLSAALLIIMSPRSGVAQQVVGGANEFSTPVETFWNVANVGWYYTPLTDLFVTSLNTRFAESFRPFGTYGSGDTAGVDRDVTIELLSDRRSAGGSLLRSTTFSSAIARGQLGGGLISGFQLEAGTRYFIGFRNVDGLGAQMAAGGDLLSNAYYDWRTGSAGPAGLYGTRLNAEVDGSGAHFRAPIIALGGPTVVPEPSTVVLLGSGLLALAIASHRRRQSAE